MLVDHFFRVAFSIDLVLLTYFDNRIQVLIQEKSDFPLDGELGLPGRLMLPNESTDRGICDLIHKLTGQSVAYYKQLHTFSEIDRHPLGRVLTFSYYSLLGIDRYQPVESPGAQWYPIDELPELCLDHAQIIEKVIRRFRKGLIRHPIAFHLLPEEFTIGDVISVYENAFSTELDHSNFSKKLQSSTLLKALDKQRVKATQGGRPARLYSYVPPTRSEFKDRIHFKFE